MLTTYVKRHTGADLDSLHASRREGRKQLIYIEGTCRAEAEWQHI
jgi:hypothetical protein